MVGEKEQEWADFIDAARDMDLDGHVDALVELCVPSLRLTPVEGSPLRSRLGGLPNVPAGFVWPVARATSGNPIPLDFVAQLDLAEIQAAGLAGAEVLPPDGTLAFFHGAYDGADHVRFGYGRVYYFEPNAVLEETHAPPGATRMPVVGLELEVLTEQLPSYETPFYALLRADELRQSTDLYGEGANAFGGMTQLYGQAGVRDDDERPVHRMLGYADPLQSDPYVNTEGYASALPPESWHTLEVFRRAAGWRLLLQLDSDPARDCYYGDGGVLAFMIREEDLASRRFDRVWVEWQSH